MSSEGHTPLDIHLVAPSELSLDVLESIISLIVQGGEVNAETVRPRLMDCALILYACLEGQVVATGAIKRPTDSGLDNAFLKAHSEHKFEEFLFELGYAVIAPDVRGKGLGRLLGKKICDSFQHENMFATIRANNEVAQHLLVENGFLPSGRVFRNRTNTQDLKLFVRRGSLRR